MTPTPQPIYTSRMKPRACSKEDLRLCSHRARQRKALAVCYALATAGGLGLAFLIWWAFGEALLNYITRP